MKTLKLFDTCWQTQKRQRTQRKIMKQLNRNRASPNTDRVKARARRRGRQLLSNWTWLTHTFHQQGKTLQGDRSRSRSPTTVGGMSRPFMFKKECNPNVWLRNLFFNDQHSLELLGVLIRLWGNLMGPSTSDPGEPYQKTHIQSRLGVILNGMIQETRA